MKHFLVRWLRWTGIMTGFLFAFAGSFAALVGVFIYLPMEFVALFRYLRDGLEWGSGGALAVVGPIGLIYVGVLFGLVLAAEEWGDRR